MGADNWFYCEGGILMNFFWHNYLPQPVIVYLGVWPIRWYGLILVSAMVLASWLSGRFLLKRNILNRQELEDLIFYLIIFGLIGARFGHIIFTWDYYIIYPLDMLKVWQGGLSMFGALLGGGLAAFVWSKKKAIKFWSLCDTIVPFLALAQAVGRWGNYFNQELYGRPTAGWWGIPISEPNRLTGFENFNYFQPAFFYESMLNLILFFVLFKFLLKNPPRLAIGEAGKLKAGSLTFLYFIGYGLIRFFLEFVRIDDTAFVIGLRWPQVISLSLVIISGICLYFINKKRALKAPL